MNSYTNNHTHIFNLKSVPDKFRGVPIGNLLSKRYISKPIAFLMKRLWPSKTDVLERFANFMLIGSRKNQNLVYEDLRSAYHLKMKFVVLSLDMDKMEAGNLINNYETQITELFEVKKKFPNELLPFISVDPRKDYPQGV